MTWTCPPPAVLPEDVDVDLTGPERALLTGMLAFQRSTLLHVCAGLTAEQLATRPLVSNLSLLGLLRHLAKVERVWLRSRAAGQDVAPLHDFDRRLDTDFDVVDPADAPAAVEQLVTEWREADVAVRDLPLDLEVEAGGAASGHPTMSLRMVYLHLVQEYARHNGHADLLRETLDGVTGR